MNCQGTNVEAIDLLIDARWVIPVNPAGRVLEHHSVAVRDGRIVAVLPAAEAHAAYLAAERVALPEHALIPGLVNLHTHASMALMRGLADDLPLMHWLQDRIWPAEAKHVSPQFVYDGTLLACAEMLRGGITCFNDMYFYPGRGGARRARHGHARGARPDRHRFPHRLRRRRRGLRRQGPGAARRACASSRCFRSAWRRTRPIRVSDTTFRGSITLAEELDLPVHMHVHETAGRDRAAASRSTACGRWSGCAASAWSART